VGTVLGALMTSLHALQGPKLGLPQLLQSRAQFGYYGAVLGYHSFLDNFVNFLDVLIFIFFPWSAINLADFYVVRHGHYEIPPFFERNGPYGLVQAPAAIAYIVGLVVELLFVNQTYYTGPLVKYINGVDISWILGFFVPFVLYCIIARAAGRRPAAVIPASPSALSTS
jgi:NCS1 family nucleobase:cation symporter-1